MPTLLEKPPAFVVIGGFTEDRRQLEPLAQAIETADGPVAGIDVFGFCEAMEHPEQVQRACRGRRVVTHSAGILAVRRAQPAPASIETWAGPEPLSTYQLVLRALAKTNHHLRRSVTGPERGEHLSVVAANTRDLVRHPRGNLRHIKAIGGFSTLECLRDAHTDGGIKDVRIVSMEEDEFFPPGEYYSHHIERNPGGRGATRQPGRLAQVGLDILANRRHDDVLMWPHQVWADKPKQPSFVV